MRKHLFGLLAVFGLVATAFLTAPGTAVAQSQSPCTPVITLPGTNSIEGQVCDSSLDTANVPTGHVATCVDFFYLKDSGSIGTVTLRYELANGTGWVTVGQALTAAFQFADYETCGIDTANGIVAPKTAQWRIVWTGEHITLCQASDGTPTDDFHPAGTGHCGDQIR